jgi:transposase
VEKIVLLKFVGVRVFMPTYTYNWSKDFLEAGKKRLSGDIKRQANSTEVYYLKQENNDLKQLVAELSLDLRRNKRNLTGVE